MLRFMSYNDMNLNTGAQSCCVRTNMIVLQNANMQYAVSVMELPFIFESHVKFMKLS